MSPAHPSDRREREADSCFFFLIVDLFCPFELSDDEEDDGDNYYAHTGW